MSLKKLTSTEKKEIKTMFNHGYSVIEICKHFKTEQPNVLQVLNQYKFVEYRKNLFNLSLLYKIKELNTKGLLKKEIMEKLEISLEQLNFYFYLIKLRYPNDEFDRLGFAREDIFKLIALAEEGYTNIEIGLKMGKKKGTVQKCLNYLMQYGIVVKRGHIKYSDGFNLSDLKEESEMSTPKTFESIDKNIDTQTKGKFMSLKNKGLTDEEVSMELHISMTTIKQLKEECEKYKIFFSN